ncbi:hypothetical protein X777_07426, partial [Ooceraea biroi]
TIPKRLNVVIKKGKDKLSNLKCTDVVYKINCSDCSACYIGQTGRHLQTGINEHRSNIRRKDHSVVSKHRLANNHDFDWSNPLILHREKHRRKREIAEMFLIKKEENTINLHTDTEDLSDVYNSIVRLS